MLRRNMAHSPMRVRSEIVRQICELEFGQLSELERRRMENTLLQILAPLYAPPRSTTPIAADSVFHAALQAKNEIDRQEALQQRKTQQESQFLRPIARASPLTTRIEGFVME